MCGRYYIDDEEEIIEIREIINEINEKYKDTPERPKMKTGEIFPTNTVPILIPEDGKRNASLMRWGFPKWDESGVVINARAETASEKPMFRTNLVQRRCLVVSTGFFEWQHVDGRPKKDKFLFRLENDPLLYMAGLYNTFKDKVGNPYTGFVILTTKANESMCGIHDRMPVILNKSRQDVWLYDNALAHALIQEETDVKLQPVLQKAVSE